MASARGSWRAALAGILTTGLVAGAAAAVLDDANQRVAQGDITTVDGRLAVLIVSEAAQGTDLNGDGDLEDGSVVHVFDAATGRTRNLGLATSSGPFILLRDRVAAIAVDEAAQQRDLNGDGDALDTVLHVLDGARSTPVNFRLAIRGSIDPIARDGSRFVVTVSEEDQGGVDLNGDGDAGDTVLHVVDVARSAARNFRLAGSTLSGFDGDERFFVFAVFEAEQGRDLNGDGDLEDPVLQVIDTDRGVVRNTGLAAGFGFDFDSGFVVIVANEFGQGNRDLNGDGDSLDGVMHIFRASNGETRNLRLDATSGFSFRKGRVLLPVSELQQGAADLNGDGDSEDTVVHAAEAPRFEPVNLHRAGSGLSIESGVALAVSEFAQGQTDLNGDGDFLDNVVQLAQRPRERDLVNTRLAVNFNSVNGVDSSADILPFLVSEDEQGGTDLNGDGDALDMVLHVADPGRGTTVNSRLAARGPAAQPFQVSGSRVVVAVPEVEQGARDLNGDGFVFDLVLHVFDAARRRSSNVGVAIDTFAGAVPILIPADGFVSTLTPERPHDLNGDGDTEDSVLHIVELDSATPTRVPLAVASIGLNRPSFFSSTAGPGFGEAFSFGVSEALQGHTDLNGDGDTDDIVTYAARIEDHNRDGILDFVQR